MKWLFVCFYSTIIFATPDAPRRHNTEDAEQTTKAVTSDFIDYRTKYGRMILFVHQEHAKQDRQVVMNWVRLFNTEKKYRGDDIIYFSSHYMRLYTDFINATGVTEFPNLIYYIGDQYEVYDGDTTNEESVLNWLEEVDQVTVLEPTTYEGLNDILSTTSNCSNKYLILGDEEQCSLESGTNIARVLKKYGIQTVRIKLPLEIYSHVALYKRLAYLSESSCQVAALLHQNFYSVFEDDISPKAIESWINERLPNDHDDCTIRHEHNWSPIKNELTELEQIYYTSERESEQKNKRPEFILVGLTGGLAVIVLAYSIFWGLNGSAFAK